MGTGGPARGRSVCVGGGPGSRVHHHFPPGPDPRAHERGREGLVSPCGAGRWGVGRELSAQLHQYGHSAGLTGAHPTAGHGGKASPPRTTGSGRDFDLKPLLTFTPLQLGSLTRSLHQLQTTDPAPSGRLIRASWRRGRKIGTLLLKDSWTSSHAPTKVGGLAPCGCYNK